MKTVLLGVTGCIAAYKACEIVRGLQKAGVRVKVVMTENATQFVGPTTFRALTREPVAVESFDQAADPIHHISLADEADLFLIAPCTANVMAKLAGGICDDLLTTTALATTAPVFLAPAMNVNMYQNAATRYNMGVLEGRGVELIHPIEGSLACGVKGKGHLAEVDDIVGTVLAELERQREEEARQEGLDLFGTSVMITAGPTVEPIDPVRFVSNYSSGKMGYALAEAAARRGANVTLVSGPVALPEPAGVEVVRVRTALEMLEAAEAAFKTADIGIFAAAVADMRPEAPAPDKLKKGCDDDRLSEVRLVKNPDILATLGQKKGDRVTVGFAAETCDLLNHARAKLASKHADFIVANEVGEHRVFGSDDNTAWVVDAESEMPLPTMPKIELADIVLDKAAELLR